MDGNNVATTAVISRVHVGLSSTIICVLFKTKPNYNILYSRLHIILMCITCCEALNDRLQIFRTSLKYWGLTTTLKFLKLKIRFFFYNTLKVVMKLKSEIPKLFLVIKYTTKYVHPTEIPPIWQLQSQR